MHGNSPKPLDLHAAFTRHRCGSTLEDPYSIASPAHRGRCLPQRFPAVRGGGTSMIAVLTVPGNRDRVPEVHLADNQPADLTGTTQLGAGVSVEIDLADPHRWRAVTVLDRDDAEKNLLEAVVGHESVRQLEQLRADLVSSGRDNLYADVPVETARSGPWRRLAVIDALDRWLQVPLEQALLDAERAVVRARAARTLRSTSAREHRNGQALMLARRSAG